MFDQPKTSHKIIGLSGLIVLVLSLLALGTALASAGNNLSTPDPDSMALSPSLALDADGNPVISYADENAAAVKLLRCNDPDCIGGDESLAILEASDSPRVLWTSLTLDSNGYPIVSYADLREGHLKVMHCNDMHCSGGDESLTTPVSNTLPAGFGSLALDNSGFPVISYVGISSFDTTSHKLTILHCNDANCSGGDETIVVVAETTAPPAIGYDTSLALDADGNPVVSYFDAATDRRDLRLLHCNDPYCEGGDESITIVADDGVVGFYSSLALDSSGNPVIAYYGSDTLKLLHCNDPYCEGGDDIAGTPDREAPTGFDPSLVLDANGFPVVAYSAFNGTKLLHCNDANCTGDDESITTPVSQGGLEFSLRLDSSGNPVVAYADWGDDLQLLHCGNPFCSTDINSAPTANPGGPYLAAVANAIQFDGGASFDPDGNTVTYAWTFGDGTSDAGATPTHSYETAGVYEVCLTVNDGALDSAASCTMAVAYDPNGGFVTGGGWLDSPAGAYKAEPSLSGHVTFGFVSKYKKGASTPDGNTAFTFELAGFDFHSSSYDWLVVNQDGSNAQFKGSGTVNGALAPDGAEYDFMLWTGDGRSSGEPDTFRIKIWWEASGSEIVVYDNGVQQSIGGGNIVVHESKGK